MKNRMPVFADADYVMAGPAPMTLPRTGTPSSERFLGLKGSSLVGFSGHGFKLAPTMGESLALVLGKTQG